MTETNRTMLDAEIERTLAQIAAITEENSETKEKLIKNLETLVEMDLKDYDTCSKSYKDEELVKVEKKKVWIDNVTRLLGAALSAVVTVLAINSDISGKFISRIGLGQAGKKLL